MRKIFLLTMIVVGAAFLLPQGGCGGGYSNSWIYSEQIQTVYVEMFDTSSFRRGYGYKLTDAICKNIESKTPYKIVSDRNIADSILSGQMSIRSTVLATDRYSARAIENETLVGVKVTWKDLKTGNLLVSGKEVYAAGSYSSALGQTFEYSADRAVNEAATRVVELMETPW